MNSRWILGFGALIALSPGAALAGNILTNSSFETVGPNGILTVFNGVSSGGPTAAQDWYVFNNTPGITTTRLEASTLPPASGGGSMMLHVTTDGGANGVLQVMGPFNTGPGCAEIGAWVYVLQGQVYIGAGNGGNTGPDVVSTTTGQWEYLEGANGVCPVNEFIVYASGGPADFFVELAKVFDVTCPDYPPDVTGDGLVDVNDMLAVIAAWGACAGCAEDVTGNNVVNIDDLLAVINAWGTCAINS